MRPGGDYLVKIYLDEQTGRLAATEKIDPYLSNENLTVKDNDIVKLTVYRRTDIGYVVIINNRHTGVLHFQRDLPGYQSRRPIPRLYQKYPPGRPSPSGENQIDVAAGRPGYARVEDAADKVLRLLQENKGRLPYHDKSDPEAIYSFFGMSKKTFKMTTGKLYKERKIKLTAEGIELAH